MFRPRDDVLRRVADVSLKNVEGCGDESVLHPGQNPGIQPNVGLTQHAQLETVERAQISEALIHTSEKRCAAVSDERQQATGPERARAVVSKPLISNAQYRTTAIGSNISQSV